MTKQSWWVAGLLGVEGKAAERVGALAQRHVRIQSGGKLVDRMLADAEQQHGRRSGQRQVTGHASAVAATDPAVTGATAGRRRRHARMMSWEGETLHGRRQRRGGQSDRVWCGAGQTPTIRPSDGGWPAQRPKGPKTPH